MTDKGEASKSCDDCKVVEQTDSTKEDQKGNEISLPENDIRPISPLMALSLKIDALNSLSKRAISSKIVTINDKNSLMAHLKANSDVVIDFFADWCGPCKMISPVLEKLSTEKPAVSFVKTNTEVAQDLAEEFRISALPTIVAIKDGKEKGRFMGVKDKIFIETFITEKLGNN